MNKDNMTLTLHELTDNQLELQNMLLNCDDEEMEQAINDTLESVELDYNAKTEGIIHVIDNIDMLQQRMKQEADEYKARANALKKRIDGLKGYMFKSMQALNIDKIETELHKIGIAKNGGKQKLTIKVEPEELPEQYQKTIIVADIDLIRKQIEDNTAEPHTWCWDLEDRGKHLTIRKR